MAILNTIMPLFFKPAPKYDPRQDEATALLRCAVDEFCAVADEVVSQFSIEEIARKDRLETLKRTGLLDAGDEEAFDCFTRLICLSLNVPQAFLSLVAEDRVVFLSKQAPPTFNGVKSAPLVESVCPFVVVAKKPLIIPDTTAVKALANHPAVTNLGVRAYLGLPITVSNGETVGALCAVDVQPRLWTPAELKIVEELTKLAIMLIDIRRLLREDADKQAALQDGP